VGVSGFMEKKATAIKRKATQIITKPTMTIVRIVPIRSRRPAVLNKPIPDFEDRRLRDFL